MPDPVAEAAEVVAQTAASRPELNQRGVIGSDFFLDGTPKGSGHQPSSSCAVPTKEATERRGVPLAANMERKSFASGS